MAAGENTYALGLNKIGYSTLVVNIFFLIFSTLIVSLRVVTRRALGNEFWVDDWLIIAAGIFFIGFCSNAYVGVFSFGGGQVYTDPTEALKVETRYLKQQIAVSTLYATTVTLIKCSILAFYHRIFAVAAFRRVNFIVGIICLLWFVAGIVSDLTYCVPLSHFWDPTVEGHCFDFNRYFLIMEIIDLVIDLVIMILPLRTIANLHLSRRKRLALLGVFSCGAFVVLTGALRIGYVYRPNVTIEFQDLASLWSTVHLGVAILCACLPLFRPWVPKVGIILSAVRSRYGNSEDRSALRYSHEHSSIQMGKPSPTYRKMNDDPNGGHSSVHIMGGDMNQSGSSLNGICVESHVVVN